MHLSDDFYPNESTWGYIAMYYIVYNDCQVHQSNAPDNRLQCSSITCALGHNAY